MAVWQIVPNPRKYPLLAKDIGAVEKTRTSTGFRPQRPQRCASTSSATTALVKCAALPVRRPGKARPLAKGLGPRNAATRSHKGTKGK